jgi:drug/metabolite transporter (DMT)-like permease
MAVLSAVCYGAALPLSRLAYDYGTNALTILSLRYLAIVLLLGMWLRFTGSPFRLAPRLILASAAVGVCFVAVSGGTLASVGFIPVNLTVVVFYTYPVMTLLIESVMERRRPTLAESLAVALALLGVALAMRVSFEHLNAPGIGFALLAATGVAGSFLIANRVLPKVGTSHLTLYACGAAFVGGASMTLAFDAVAFPTTAFGIGLVAVIIAVFATAVITMFVAVRRIGPVRAATFLCLEPVTAIFVAVLTLGEHLKAGQWLGVVLVGMALLIASRRPAA